MNKILNKLFGYISLIFGALFAIFLYGKKKEKDGKIKKHLEQLDNNEKTKKRMQKAKKINNSVSLGKLLNKGKF